MKASSSEKDETKVKDVQVNMYIVMNKSLEMGKGKLCSQSCHAVAAIVRKFERNPTSMYKKWLFNNEPKIVLKATEEELIQLSKKYSTITYEVHDAGKTQIAPNSFTALGFYPMPVNDVPSIDLQSLKLL